MRKDRQSMVGRDTPFPSRSIRQLEQFLHDHDVDEKYRNNDSKFKMACRAVNDLDTCHEKSDQLHETLVSLLESLASSKMFSDFRGNVNEADQRDGIKYLNEILAKHGLEIRLEDGEQLAIADMLEVAEREVLNMALKLDALKRQENGLMQQLLTGKVRVSSTQEESQYATS